MNFAMRLLQYAGLVGCVSLGLWLGAASLLRSDPSFKAEARVAPIAPRIAESIERKKQIALAPEPVAAPVQQPPMQEMTASLTPSPVVRDLNPPPRPKHKPKAKPPAIETAAAREPQSAPAVSTARSDVPF